MGLDQLTKDLKDYIFSLTNKIINVLSCNTII